MHESASKAIPCLTIHQPFAELIACGVKRIENRTWGAKYRGWLGIHASQRRDLAHVEDPLPAACGELHFGAIVAVGRLVQVITGGIRSTINDPRWLWVFDDPYYEGPVAWVLEDVRRVGPIACSGARMLWYPAEAVQERLRGAIPCR